MSALLNQLPEDLHEVIYDFIYDRPLKKKVLNELKCRTKCISCEGYLSPTFCKIGANFCSLSCFNDPTKEGYVDFIDEDEYLEELYYLANRT